MTAAIQTLWAELLARTLADAGVATVVISPGSRSTPIVAALAREARLTLISIIDERSAAFFALGEARVSANPVALVCTSGSAAAHYLPAIVEASMANVPLVAITADRPPELQHCGASQTIDQHALYGSFVRGSFDLGAPAAEGFHALRARLAQAITRARGPVPGPVHIDVPLRKPLEPAAPTTDFELELAKRVYPPLAIATPRLAVEPKVLDAIATAIESESHGVIVVGAMPLAFAAARDSVNALAQRGNYPLIAEVGSQVRTKDALHRFDLIAAAAPAPKLVIQIGAEPVSASWPGWARDARRVVFAESWNDPTSTATVVLGDVIRSVRELVARLPAPEASLRSTATALWERAAFDNGWRNLERAADAAIASALEQYPTSETAAVRAAVAAAGTATLQIGNSLPIRVVEHALGVTGAAITQRGASGIDGLVASAAGATRAGKPVLLILGDVSFAHDVGSLLAARNATAPLAILVIDNGGGQIFSGMPVAQANLGDAFAKHFTTPPALDPVAVALAFGARAMLAKSPVAIAAAVTAALGIPGVTVIHAPVSPSGAHDVRRAALAQVGTA